MKRHLISVFTPSNTDPEVLERIFVQRHRLLEKIVDCIKRSMLTGDKHHVLLIGPRGSGKTNMVTLAQHRFLLLIVENLDAAFKGLGDQGLKRWRAFLQEKGRVATLATAQQIFDAVSDRDFPFWEFFDIHHLAPLSFEDARILIRNISVENENRELVQFLDTADGRYRIRSLHHLAGGNHRMYVLLSEFLTKDSLDDLVAAFETLADELTPYFRNVCDRCLLNKPKSSSV